MDGSELGAHACDHPPVCEHAHANGWMFLHTCAFPCSSCTRACICEHTRSYTHIHTRVHTHTNGPAAWHGSNPHFQLSRTRRWGTTRRPLGPMQCDVPQFPLLAQPSTPTPPALVGPWVAGASSAGWSLARPRGWHRRHFPEPITSNHQPIQQPNTTVLPVPQPNHPSWGQLPLRETA